MRIPVFHTWVRHHHLSKASQALSHHLPSCFHGPIPIGTRDTAFRNLRLLPTMLSWCFTEDVLPRAPSFTGPRARALFISSCLSLQHWSRNLLNGNYVLDTVRTWEPEQTRGARNLPSCLGSPGPITPCPILPDSCTVSLIAKLTSPTSKYPCHQHFFGSSGT